MITYKRADALLIAGLLAAAATAVFLSLDGCSSGNNVVTAFARGGTQDGNPDGPLVPNYRDSVSASRWRLLVVTYRLVNAPQIDPSFTRRQVATAVHKWDAPLGGYAVIHEATGGETEGITIRLVKPGSLGDNEITGTHDTTGTRNLGATTLTYAGGDPARGIIHANVSISSGLLATPGSFIRAVAHETGHALGILGHSPDTGDLMFASYEGEANRTLQDYDTLRLIYREQK